VSDFQIDNYQLVFHYIPLAYIEMETREPEMKIIYLKSVSACLLTVTGMPVIALDLADAEKQTLPTMIVEGEILTPGLVGVKPDIGGVNDAAALLQRVPGLMSIPMARYPELLNIAAYLVTESMLFQMAQLISQLVLMRWMHR